MRVRERSPINYSLGIGHVPFICVHLTNRHSRSQKSREHRSHNLRKVQRQTERDGARADIVIKEKMYAVNLLNVGGRRCV